MIISDYAIQPGLPIPTPHSVAGPGPATRYPYHRMQVGDSFFVPSSTVKQLAVGHWQRVTGFRFSRRAVTEGGVKGNRIWRTQ